MALILMTKSPHGLTIRKTQPALATFQCLDGRFLINTDDKGILRWLQIKAYDIGGLLGKLWVGVRWSPKFGQVVKVGFCS